VVRRDEALSALRRQLAGREFEFATMLEVRDGGPDRFLVRARAGRRLHPHTLVVAADERSLALDHGLGEPLPADDVQLWASGVVLWLEEQLDTGVLRWGRRITLQNGTVAIDPSLDPGPPSPWYVSSVPLERPTPAGQGRLRRSTGGGQHGLVAIGGGRIELEPDPAPGGSLQDLGFDVGPGRAAHAVGGLVRWLQVFPDSSGGSRPVGQLVVSWRDEPEAVAELEYLELGPSVPRGAVEELVLAGIHGAADAGARWIEHRLDDVARLDLGLRWRTENGVRRLDAAEVP
jgi:hypothetical protein